MREDRIVYLEGVSKVYRQGDTEVYAAQNVTLDVKTGEFYSLLGSSGSGKTTTLRMIGGFEIPEFGQVYINGEDVTLLPPYRRNVHTVFQSYALFPHLTVAENVAYPLRIARLSGSEIAPRVQEALRMFRIEGLGDRRPSQLSGGQQQRVALARALISRPKVLLLDEPLSALDAKIRGEVRQELRDLQKQTNITFIYVTHDQEEALALSDRIAVMSQGQVEQVGTPREIYNRPATRFVAQFIGKANFLQGTVVETRADLACLEVQETRFWAIAPHSPQVGTLATLMVRPERIKLEHGEHKREVISLESSLVNPSEVMNRLPATIIDMTYVGQLMELHLQTPVGVLRATQLGGEGAIAETPTMVWTAPDCVLLPQSSN